MEKSNKVLSGGQLAGGNSASKREEHDFYATDPQTVRLSEIVDYLVYEAQVLGIDTDGYYLN